MAEHHCDLRACRAEDLDHAAGDRSFYDSLDECDIRERPRQFPAAAPAPDPHDEVLTPVDPVDRTRFGSGLDKGAGPVRVMADDLRAEPLSQGSGERCQLGGDL